jgi:hypothetical protein
VRLSYLAPDLTRQILEGRHPRDLTAQKLLSHSRLPLGWPEQRRLSASPEPGNPDARPLDSRVSKGTATIANRDTRRFLPAAPSKRRLCRPSHRSGGLKAARTGG